ncbi:hypothetical protein GQ55_3G175400 [Panicum hallii var. hallii]|jgi:hypothetical protein|uniref:Uncharacterized protein n=2 Tax=Panicum hallii TaxID=206008 RepID=A0A2T7EAJ9_9POAL|nr:hypothetical protein PAHAL_3G185800 [Panicum hallii]PUZ64847.1 hypothetical protein GQ55_3G175400 [Panicum hallii var. hallii]
MNDQPRDLSDFLTPKQLLAIVDDTVAERMLRVDERGSEPRSSFMVEGKAVGLGGTCRGDGGATGLRLIRGIAVRNWVEVAGHGAGPPLHMVELLSSTNLPS